MSKMFFTILIMLFISNNSLFGQENTEASGEVGEATSIKIREWNEFQSTQEKLLAKQEGIIGRLGDMNQRIRQININLLSWQDATQNAAAGDNRGCDLFKTKYDPRVEWTVVGLAIWGIYLTLNKFFGVFRKRPPVVPTNTPTNGV